MKKFLLFFLLSLSFSFSYGQCPNHDIYLSSQEDIDNFKTRYPGCTQFSKTLHIYGNTITNLNGLDELTATTYVVNISRTNLVNLTGLENITEMGTLKIWSNDLLENLSGIGQLTEIDGNFTLQNNGALTDLTHLGNLTKVNFAIDIDNNDALVTLNGLENLSQVGGLILQNGRLIDISALNQLEQIAYTFTVKNEYNLENLVDFNNLLSLSGDVLIASNRVLQSITGFNNVPSVRSFEVYDNEALTSITGFNQLETISGDFILGSSPTYKWGENPVLANISGLTSLTTVSQNFYVGDNTVLPNLNGLQNLETIGKDMSIFRNDSLTSLYGLDNLTSVGGRFLISSNKSLIETDALLQLNTVGDDVGIWWNETIQSLKGLDGLQTIGGSLNIGWNPDTYLQSYDVTKSLNEMTLSELTSVGGDFKLGFCSIPIIDGMNKLSQVEGELKISNSHYVTEISGFNQLTSVNEIKILSIDDLGHISGFSAVPAIPKNLQLSGNDDLTTISGFQALQSIGEDFILNYNSNLTDALGLSNLKTIGEDFILDHKDGNFSADPNHSSLPNFQSFSSLESIGKGFIVGPNTSLVNFTGLENLTSIGEDFYIKTGLPQISPLPHLSSLNSLAGLNNLQSIGRLFKIEYNSALLNLNGLNSLATVGNNFDIKNNISLENLATLSSLTTTGRDFTISGNSSLINLTGLETLHTVTGHFNIQNNDALQNISGLNNLVSVGNLNIYNNEVLSELTSLSSLSQISSTYGSLTISNNDSLPSLVGLEKVTDLKRLTIFFNSNLQSLSGLDSLQSLTDYLSIDRNPILSDISALENADIGRDVSLGIKNNASLAVCNIKSICTYASYGNTSSFIYNNLPGCDSKYEIFLRCPNPDDLDGDGVLNSTEDTDGTDANDGCSYLEVNQDINLISVLWEEADCDNDGILNGTELTNGSNPRNQDSDGDGILDGDDSNPTDACLPLQNKEYTSYDSTNAIWQNNDCDLDGINNGDELTAGTNPYFNESFYTDSTYPDTFNEQQIETNGSARSIATNGTTVAVGRRWGSVSKVEIYTKNASNIWGKTQEILPPNSQGSAKFGWTLTMNENTLFIARSFGIQNQPDTIFIYQKDSNGIWVETQQIQASSDFMEDGFGISMDVSENTIVIGADGIAPAGAVYVFEKNGNNTWVETTELYPSDELFEGSIGHSVAISQNQIIVGASGYGEHGAFIYEKQNDNTWLEIQQLSASDGQNYTFARDVSIAGNRLIIGDISYSDVPENWNKGKTLVYEKSYGGLWTQVQTLHAGDGYVGDYFGDALANNDNRIVVNKSADGTDVGSLHIFHKSEGAWVETHELTDPLGFSWNFGRNVALAPGLIVATSDEYVHFFEDSLSSQDTDGDGVDNVTDSHPNDPCLPVQLAGYTGYDTNNEIWANADCDNDGITNADEVTNNTDPYQENSIEEDCTDITLVGSDAAPNELFGKFVAISPDGNTTAVSAYFDTANGNYSGAVYIFKKQSDGSWLETQKLTASDAAEGNYFGLSLAFSENNLVIGSYGRNYRAGAVYIFNENQDNDWTETQIITPSDSSLYSHFGYAVAINQNHLIVGSPNDGENGTWSGAAYIFKKEQNGTWSEVQKLAANDAAAQDTFGISVSISNNTAIVGSHQDDDMGENSGSAYIFENSNNVWAQTSKLNSSNGLASDFFGKNVSISTNTVVVSSLNGGESGTAYIYDKSNLGEWQETSRLKSPSGSTDDYFADKILLQEDLLVISATKDDENGTDTGSAYVYHKTANSWSLINKITSCTPTDYASFGDALTLSGNTLVIGTGLGSSVGSAYVYEIDIPNPEPLTITIENNGISCNGANDASVTIQATGGTPSYLYVLANPAFGNTFGNRTGQFSNLRTGDYVVTVSDDLGVEVSQPITITEAAPLNLSTIVEQTCEDEANGSLSIEVSGGIPPYQYSIDNGITFENNAVFTNLPAGEYITVIQDANGCTFTQLVSISVDETCSQLTLPINNFTIQTTDESCASSNNGSIIVRADVNLEYTATLMRGNMNESKGFRTFTNFQELESGTYELCITVSGETNYQKCFSINIAAPESLEVDSSLDPSGKSVSLNLKGGEKYFIDLNGTEYATSDKQITIPLSKIENNITVKTDKECQGVYENIVMAVYNSISIFPNPVEKGDVTIELPDAGAEDVLITLFSQNGIRVLEKMEKPENRTVKINMDDLPSGIYTIIITTESQNSMRKIIKK